jgi:predicted transcriptional regulator
MSEQKIPVREFMVKNVVTVNSSDSIKETAKKLYVKRVGSAIVLENNKPVGIITVRDISNSIGPFENSLESQVKEIMSQPLIHIHPEESIIDVTKIMTYKNIHKLPVIINDEILGMISSSDIVVIFSMLKNESLAEIFRAYLHK